MRYFWSITFYLTYLLHFHLSNGIVSLSKNKKLMSLRQKKDSTKLCSTCDYDMSKGIYLCYFILSCLIFLIICSVYNYISALSLIPFPDKLNIMRQVIVFGSMSNTVGNQI